MPSFPRLITRLLALSFLASSNLWAADDPFAKLPQGQSLLPENPLEKLNAVGQTDLLKTQMVDLKDQSFGPALEITNTEKPSQIWDVKLATRGKEAIKKGDLLVLAFRAKTVATTDETGAGYFGVAIEPKPGSYMDGFMYRAAVPTEWTTFILPYKAKVDFKKKQAQLDFRFGVKPQTVLLADLRLVNAGPELQVSDVQTPQFTYEGRALDSPWRAKADQMIDQHRKADLKIIVKDEAGNPIPDAKVGIEQTRHEYGFGSVVKASWLAESSPAFAERATYREKVKELFNIAGLENGMKWPKWEGIGNNKRGEPRKPTRDYALAATKWLKDKGIPSRGHVLFWGKWKFMLDEAKQQKDPKAYLQNRIREHFKDILAATKGQLYEWDVINEPGYYNERVLKLLGQEAMLDWFSQAHELAPEARLYLNEFFILSKGGKDVVQQNGYFELIEYLTKNNAPIGGIGMQGHMGLDMTTPERIWEILDRFRKFGLPIMVTEFDVDIDDEKLQADYTRDFMIAVFSHPSTSAIQMWGFWDGGHWRDNAPIFRKDWSVKPSGEEWKRLVFDEWWTEEEIDTDAKGIANVRAFRGNHHVTARKGDLNAEQQVTLGQDGQTLEIVLK